jgi:hypothetical protein
VLNDGSGKKGAETLLLELEFQAALHNVQMSIGIEHVQRSKPLCLYKPLHAAGDLVYETVDVEVIAHRASVGSRARNGHQSERQHRLHHQTACRPAARVVIRDHANILRMRLQRRQSQFGALSEDG